MHSVDKVWAIFWTSLFSTILIIVITICIYRQNTAPQRLEEAKLEYTYKIKCVELGGNWAAVDGDSRVPYACKK